MIWLVATVRAAVRKLNNTVWPTRFENVLNSSVVYCVSVYMWYIYFFLLTHTHSFLVFYTQPITLIRDITDQTTVANRDAVFECEIKINYPEITLSWYKGTQKLDTSDKYEIKVVGDRHILKLKNCQPRDEGSYRIVCGPHISGAKLTVLGMYCISDMAYFL